MGVKHSFFYIKACPCGKFFISILNFHSLTIHSVVSWCSWLPYLTPYSFTCLPFLVRKGRYIHIQKSVYTKVGRKPKSRYIQKSVESFSHQPELKTVVMYRQKKSVDTSQAVYRIG